MSNTDMNRVPALMYVKYEPGKTQVDGFIGMLGMKISHLSLPYMDGELYGDITEWVNYWIGETYDGEIIATTPKDKREGLKGGLQKIMNKIALRMVDIMIEEGHDKTKPWTQNAAQLAVRAAVKKAEIAGAKVKKVTKKKAKKKASKKVSKKAKAQLDMPI